MIINKLKIRISKWNKQSRFRMIFFSSAINSENLDEKENSQRYMNIKDYSLNDGIFKISLEFEFMDC